MLSDREEQQLAAIERWLAADYPDFPRYMARARKPFPWHRLAAAAVLLAWLGCTAAAMVFGSWQDGIVPAALAVVAVGMALGTGWRRRRYRR